MKIVKLANADCLSRRFNRLKLIIPTECHWLIQWFQFNKDRFHTCTDTNLAWRTSGIATRYSSHVHPAVWHLCNCFWYISYEYETGVLVDDSIIIRTLHGCPSQMNENSMINNNKSTTDSE